MQESVHLWIYGMRERMCAYDTRSKNSTSERTWDITVILQGRGTSLQYYNDVGHPCNITRTWDITAILQGRGTSLQCYKDVGHPCNITRTWDITAILQGRGTSLQHYKDVGHQCNITRTWDITAILQGRWTSLQCYKDVGHPCNITRTWDITAILQERGTSLQYYNDVGHPCNITRTWDITAILQQETHYYNTVNANLDNSHVVCDWVRCGLVVGGKRQVGSPPWRGTQSYFTTYCIRVGRRSFTSRCMHWPQNVTVGLWFPLKS